MAVKSFNIISISACVGIIFLFATLWNLQGRPEYLPGFSSHNETAAAPQSSSDEQLATAYKPSVVEDTKHQDSSAHSSTSSKPYPEVDMNKIPAGKKPAAQKNRPSFTEIANKWGTDKVTTHNYHYMYEKYMEPIRDDKIKMLEIGLGCDMNYGPGKSYHTWLEFFPNVDMYYIEYDAECVEKWSANITDAKVFTGSQEDVSFLNSFIAQSGGGFDIIIDDGGHTMNQQIVSLNTLFPIVVPGGIYFCEDLATSYIEKYGGGLGVKKTMMHMIMELLDDLNVNLGGAPAQKHEVATEMRSIECGEEICAFFKKDIEI